MSFEFLHPEAVANDAWAPIARSPMERRARACGARFEVREGWSVAVGYGSAEHDDEAWRSTVGWADVSHLGKLELQASPDDLRTIAADGAGGAGVSLELGRATRAAGAWWCPLSQARALVVCDPGVAAGLRERLSEAAAGASAPPASVTDVTTAFAAMTLAGPHAREVFARFCAIDLRPSVTPVAGLRPGSIARQPGIVLREAEDRFLMLFGWAVAEYMWTVVDDAGCALGGRPVGVDALAALGRAAEESGVPSHA
ncbi:MAG: aminomethyltransferase family protein [Solirubrobacterales bacterium]|nr:aminomethyltransferase family protein [Solirubrobacterales bacterium]MBV9423880.1 aminomethyltransferase family protein [Solirubrobacterales bacterium]MBV9800333.1 aminomethyltransferase family protein [Solirubrobacterales bacterium]